MSEAPRLTNRQRAGKSIPRPSVAQFGLEPAAVEQVRAFAAAKALTMTEAYRHLLRAGLEMVANHDGADHDAP